MFPIVNYFLIKNSYISYTIYTKWVIVEWTVVDYNISTSDWEDRYFSVFEYNCNWFVWKYVSSKPQNNLNKSKIWTKQDFLCHDKFNEIVIKDDTNWYFLHIAKILFLFFLSLWLFRIIYKILFKLDEHEKNILHREMNYILWLYNSLISFLKNPSFQLIIDKTLTVLNVIFFYKRFMYYLLIIIIPILFLLIWFEVINKWIINNYKAIYLWYYTEWIIIDLIPQNNPNREESSEIDYYPLIEHDCNWNVYMNTTQMLWYINEIWEKVNLYCYPWDDSIIVIDNFFWKYWWVIVILIFLIFFIIIWLIIILYRKLKSIII